MNAKDRLKPSLRRARARSLLCGGVKGASPLRGGQRPPALDRHPRRGCWPAMRALMCSRRIDRGGNLLCGAGLSSTAHRPLAASYGRTFLVLSSPPMRMIFGNCERSIDGAPALQKARLDIVVSMYILGMPSRAWLQLNGAGAWCHGEADAVYFRAY